MNRRANLELLTVAPRPAWTGEHLATFRLTWGEERHLLGVAVPAADAAGAEAAARAAMVARLREMIGQVARAPERPPSPVRRRPPTRLPLDGLAPPNRLGLLIG